MAVVFTIYIVKHLSCPNPISCNKNGFTIIRI